MSIKNSINPALKKYSLIEYNKHYVEVMDIDDEYILITDQDSVDRKISDDEWIPIFLNDEWLSKLNLKLNQPIRNVRTNDDWTIRKSGRYHYLTISQDPSLGENPVIAIHEVHDLQHWYFLLTSQYLRLLK